VGTLTGRVFNPGTQEYVRDAEVSVEGTNLRVATESGGFFTLNNVPVGQQTVTVKYSGYATASETVNVTTGENPTRTIEIVPVGTQAGLQGQRNHPAEHVRGFERARGQLEGDPESEAEHECHHLGGVRHFW
jgi:hypothetical protein